MVKCQKLSFGSYCRSDKYRIGIPASNHHFKSLFASGTLKTLYSNVFLSASWGKKHI